MNEIVSNISVLHPASLKYLNDQDLLKMAIEFIDLYKKNIYRLHFQKKLSAFGQLSHTISKINLYKENRKFLNYKESFIAIL
jgi:hypothetical protein